MTDEIKTLQEPEMRKHLAKGETFVLARAWEYCACRWDGHEAHPIGNVTTDWDEAVRQAERG